MPRGAVRPAEAITQWCCGQHKVRNERDEGHKQVLVPWQVGVGSEVPVMVAVLTTGPGVPISSQFVRQ